MFLSSVLFASTINAADISTYTFTTRTWNATLNSVVANWTCDSMAYQTNAKGMQVTMAYNTAGATSPVSFDNIKQIVVTYGSTTQGEGSVEVKIGTNAAVSKACEKKATDKTLVYDYDEPQSGYVSFKGHVTTNSIYIKSISITHNYSAAAPDIQANKIVLPTALIGIGDSGYAKDTTLVVTGVNLTEPIGVSFTGTHLSSTEDELPAAGGTLHLHVAASSAMQLADSVVLTANGVTTKVAVVGKIKQNIALPGTAATITKGTEATDATVDGVSAVKVGTSTNNGNVTITIPSKTIKLRFYAAAWTGTSGNLSVSAPTGVTLETTSVTILPDAGITGSSPFTLDALTPTAYKCEVTLSGVASARNITISSGTARRFVIWDAKCDIDPTPDPDAEDYSFNYLNKAGEVYDTRVVSLSLPLPPVVAGFTFLYWKAVEGNIADGINIQAVYQANEPTEAPAVVVDPANPSQKLIREGNVYILHGDQQYNLLGTRIR